MNQVIGEWIAEGTTVYELQETGRYRKGEAILENKVFINVQGACSQKEKEKIAKLISASNDLLAIAIRVKNINKIAREHMSDDLFISIESAINKATL